MCTHTHIHACSTPFLLIGSESGHLVAYHDLLRPIILWPVWCFKQTYIYTYTEKDVGTSILTVHVWTRRAFFVVDGSLGLLWAVFWLHHLLPGCKHNKSTNTGTFKAGKRLLCKVSRLISCLVFCFLVQLNEVEAELLPWPKAAGKKRLDFTQEW